MNLEQIEVGETIGIELKNGTAQFFRRTRKGLEGPFLDRDCSIPYTNPDLQAEIDRNAMAQRVYATGKRRRFQHFRMSDGCEYETNKNGTVIRQTAKLSKKERKAVAQENREKARACATAHPVPQDPGSGAGQS